MSQCQPKQAQRTHMYLLLYLRGRKRSVRAAHKCYQETLLIITFSQLLAKYQKIACLDSTHNTCFSATGKEEKAYLYTVVVKNLATGKGSPVAFMITPSEAQYAIMDFLRWLKAMGFIPNCWMIDCSDTEIAGIRSAYGVDVLVFECLWHVLKAITEQAKKKLNVGAVPLGATKVEANKQLRASAKADFTRLIHAATSDDFEEVWQEIEVAYAEYTAWMAYLRTEWMGKKERWALAWRKVRDLRAR